MDPTAINQITIVLTIVLVFVLFVLGMIYVYLMIKSNKENEDTKKEETTTSTGTTKGISKHSINKFMEFEKIEDNMIVQKEGFKYIMVVQCKGVNYDLMSEIEKISVEEGFIQFLNTLRSRVQIYIQTRTINLEDSINTYKERTATIEREYEKNKILHGQLERSEKATVDELERANYELLKQQNLIEYGKDIISYTEKMSLNKNVLQKQYYIIIPYYSSEIGTDEFGKEEIKNIAFSELYTRAQAIIRSLSICGIESSVMDSYELTDLLYVAYNRDEAEVYGLNKALLAGYDELYTTAEDVTTKKMRQLEKMIEESAIQMAEDVLGKLTSEDKTEEIQETLEDLIMERAKILLEESRENIDGELIEQAKAEIDLSKEERIEEKGGISDEKTKKRTIKKRTA